MTNIFHHAAETESRTAIRCKVYKEGKELFRKAKKVTGESVHIIDFE